ncbi:MAG: hypothetical protein KatS3mg125_1521 [Lysobacterales bacterium]|nr:MAG: hypothetical protein KatS3mg125_1521 [Xanthomonadales bacterium]
MGRGLAGRLARDGRRVVLGLRSVKHPNRASAAPANTHNVDYVDNVLTVEKRRARARPRFPARHPLLHCAQRLKRSLIFDFQSMRCLFIMRIVLDPWNTLAIPARTKWCSSHPPAFGPRVLDAIEALPLACHHPSPLRTGRGQPLALCGVGLIMAGGESTPFGGDRLRRGLRNRPMHAEGAAFLANPAAKSSCERRQLRSGRLIRPDRDRTGARDGRNLGHLHGLACPPRPRRQVKSQGWLRMRLARRPSSERESRTR